MLQPTNLKFFTFYRFVCFLQQVLLRKKGGFVALNSYTPEYYLAQAPHLPQIARFLQKQWYCRFQTLAELSGLDYPGKVSRFRIFYSLVSYQYTMRVTLMVALSDRTIVPTLSTVFAGAVWQEREVWDLFGIFFQGNRDLRRILTDYGFAGHPLRKDFPLTGFSEILYDDRKKQILYRPVSLAQEFRSFTSVNPWISLPASNGRT